MSKVTPKHRYHVFIDKRADYAYQELVWDWSVHAYEPPQSIGHGSTQTRWGAARQARRAARRHKHGKRIGPKPPKPTSYEIHV